jgi:dTDP-glucose pyrophosphorylase
MKDINKYIVNGARSIRQAVKTMDKGGIGFCVCVDSNDKVIGILTDGDFRRAVLSDISLDKQVKEIINRNFISVQKNHDEHEIKDLFTDSIVQHIPVLDSNRLIDIYTEETFFGIKNTINRKKLNFPVVVMAGGKGTRMDPFTRILPKPLLPIGDEPIIKVIMDEFGKYGADNYYISLNDKGRMIKAYFSDHELPYQIEYIEEEKPLGTAGALKYLEGAIQTPFFVSNCDIIIKADYSSIIDFHVNGSYDLTVVSSMCHYVIPYGVCDIGNNGDLRNIREKPEYDLLVNTGMYVIEPRVLKYIPNNEVYDMPQLINDLQKNGCKIGVFPISEDSWSDVGQWEEYANTLRQLNL